MGANARTRAPAATNVTRVRVGVVLDGPRVPAWAAWIVDAIHGHGDLELALAIECDRVRARRASILFSAYEALDRRLFRRHPDALELVDLSPTLEDVPTLEVPAIPDDPGGRRLRGEDVDAVSRQSLDVILSLGANPPGGMILSAARYGVWSLHHGDPVRYRGEPPFFWELFFGEPASTSVLEMLTDDSTLSGVIYRSVSATDAVSLQRNRNSSYWKSARIVLRRLEGLAAARWTPDPEPTGGHPAQARGAPSNAATLRHVARIARRVGVRRMRNEIHREQLFLGFREHRPGILPYESVEPWRVALPPPDRYWADPFVLHEDGETLVFFEEVRWARDKGELVVGRLDDECRLTDVEPILPATHHLSYPYVLRDEGRTFMIPESGEAGRVELWAATDFPLGWELVGPLLEGSQAVDASVVRHAGQYWMWLNHSMPGGRRDDEVFLYFSDELATGWTPHPLNPVVSDARRARPAGRPYLHGGTLIRPAQDCTGRYGARVVFNAVELLTTENYSEHPIGSLTPAWAGKRNLAAHTYTFDGGWEATDGLRLIPRWRRSRPGRWGQTAQMVPTAGSP
jgi:hypothetical protein